MDRNTDKPDASIEILKHLKELDGATNYDALSDWWTQNHINTGFNGAQFTGAMEITWKRGFISEKMENHVNWYQITPEGLGEIERWNALETEELAEVEAEKKEVADRRKKAHYDGKNAKFIFKTSRWTFWLALGGAVLGLLNAFKVFDRYFPVSPPSINVPKIDSPAHPSTIPSTVDSTFKKG